MSWRDDLPEIPTERIRGQVVRDGGARRTAARQRRNTMLAGASLAAVVVLAVAGIIAVSGPSDDRNGDAADATSPAVTDAAAGTSPAATSPEATSAATEAPADTEAAAETTSGASETTVPFITDVRVDPTTVWEAPVGGTACGPVAFAVTATAPGAQRAIATARTTDGLRVERAMDLDGDLATAVFDGFPADTVEPGGRAELLLEVVVTDPGGVQHSVAGPVVELLDCPP